MPFRSHSAAAREGPGQDDGLTRTPAERLILSFILGTIPSALLGFYAGCISSDVRAVSDLGLVLVRSLIFCALPVGLAAFLPRYWLIPTVIYSVAFHLGASLLEDIGSSIVTVLVWLPFAWLPGGGPGIRPVEPHHSEYPWVFLLGFWAASFAAFLSTRRLSARARHP